MKIGITSACLLTVLTVAPGCQANGCDSNVLLSDKNGTTARVENHTVRKLSPQFFGFNLELAEFQNSLWSNKETQVEPSVVEYLRRFPGAVYRYPGGTVANHFDWKAAVGPLSSRLAQKIVDWQAARVVQFGPEEYLNFVKAVNGTAWYVLNLYGTFDGANQLDLLTDSASQLASFMSNQRSKGLPSVYRWELGNELDRGRYKWPASKYVVASKEVVRALRNNYKDAEIVGMAQDWEHTGASIVGINYNTVVARELKADAREFAGHLYYDGAPWGPAVPRVLRQLCKNLESVRHGAPDSVMWVTEHGRTPLGTPDDPGWKLNWPQTGDLGAAISVADMMISLARMSNIKGAFVHSLHGTSGPWPIFHKQSDGALRPSAVYWAMVLLREVLLEDVLKTHVSTSNSSANGVGYDSNMVVLSNPDRSRFSVWMVNRGQGESVAKFSIPPLAGTRIAVKVTQLRGDNMTDGNYVNPYKIFPVRSEIPLDVSRSGEFSLTVPAHSVFVASLEVSPS